MINQNIVIQVLKAHNIFLKTTDRAKMFQDIQACLNFVEFYKTQIESKCKPIGASVIRKEISRLDNALKMSSQSLVVFMLVAAHKNSPTEQGQTWVDAGNAVAEAVSLLRKACADYAADKELADKMVKQFAKKAGPPFRMADRHLIEDLARTFERHTGRKATPTPAGAFSDFFYAICESKIDCRRLLQAVLGCSRKRET